MASVNKVILLGRLGRDVEVRYTPSGAAVANLSIATSRQWKDKQSGERVEEVEWHALVAYDRLAEIAGEYLKKGSEAYFEGRLKTHKYNDKNGVEKYKTEIVVEQLQLLGGRARNDGDGGDGGGGGRREERGTGGRRGSGQSSSAPKGGGGFDDSDESIPF